MIIFVKRYHLIPDNSQNQMESDEDESSSSSSEEDSSSSSGSNPSEDERLEKLEGLRNEVIIILFFCQLKIS